MDATPTRMTARDYLLLAAFCFALFLTAALTAKMLTGHASVLAQNSREMMEDGDWLLPKVGGEVWLERPPVPDWFICGVYAVAGTSSSDPVARLAAVLVAVPIVLLVASTASLLYGRSAGLIAGGVFATMQELYSYAFNPEADIFLCLIVTATVAVFARLEFGSYASRSGESGSFVGRRPWLVLAFFLLLGATNLAKGVIFGTVMAGLPVAGYLLWNRSWGPIKRYIWLWGWLAAIAVAIAWPLAVIQRYPEILDLWKEHYFGRLNKGYLREAWWYYAVNVPFVLLPWAAPALLGLWQTRKIAFAGPGPERFLWGWAILPPLVFSLSDGKHHHYLLQCMAPWAILAVGGCVTIWKFCRERLPSWGQNPWPLTVVAGIGTAAALFAIRHKHNLPDWFVISGSVFVPVLTFILMRSLVHPNPRRAFAGVMAVLALGYSGWTASQAHVRESYRYDAAMLRQATTVVPTDAPLYVQYDWVGPLETFWVLYHTPRPGTLVRDPWDVREKAAGRTEAFVLARRLDAPGLAQIGQLDPVLVSEKTRMEPGPEYRRVLYRIKFHPTPPPPPPELQAQTRRTLW
jgi:4-amino-4-deoxy-L-arabinose transferase-like glycosyltransferase